jgi:ATP-dependent RNA circularization protein (DNA/RNA ligase family)
MQEYVDKIVELLENTKKDETGVRFYIKDILWENNSKELPSQAFVDLWDSQGIADMSSFGKKLMKALGEKYDSKVLRANPDLTKIDLVTRE